MRISKACVTVIFHSMWVSVRNGAELQPDSTFFCVGKTVSQGWLQSGRPGLIPSPLKTRSKGVKTEPTPRPEKIRTYLRPGSAIKPYRRVFPNVKISFSSALIYIFDRNIQFNNSTEHFELEQKLMEAEKELRNAGVAFVRWPETQR